MKKSKVLFTILVVFSFFVLSYFLTKKILQNDTFYTVKIGESILKNGIDMKDHFSWIPNLSYTYPHALFDLVIYLLYSVGGFTSLYILVIMCGFTTLMLMYLLCKKITGNTYLSYLLVLFLSFGLGGFFAARAQVFSYPLMLLILYFIEKIRETNEKKYYVFMFILSVLVANIHLAVWPLISVLFLPFIVQDLIYIYGKKNNFLLLNYFHLEVEESKLKPTLIALCICLLSGFMTPNFLVPFTYFINTKRGVSMSHISEHMPSSISSRPELYILLFIFILLALNKNTKIKLRDFFMLSGLFLLSFMSIRNTNLLVILGSFSFARMFNSFMLKDILEAVSSSAFCITIMVFFVILLSLGIIKKYNVSYIDVKDYPVEASDYIIENYDYKNIKIYNEYNYGSYLMYRGIPVFIDSRADLYLQEFNPGCKVYKDFLIMFDDYENLFNKYGVTHVLLKTTSNLHRLLELDTNYQRVYRDSYFIIYEKLN